jgi:glucose-6-phosphate isomerase
MNVQELIDTARTLVAGDKSLLAMDESTPSFHQMDEHFRTAPFERNLPVLMGLLALW